MYAAPGGDLCFWTRLSGFGGTLDEVLATDFGSLRCRRETGYGCSPSSVHALSIVWRNRRFWYAPTTIIAAALPTRLQSARTRSVIAVTTPNCWNGVNGMRTPARQTEPISAEIRPLSPIARRGLHPSYSATSELSRQVHFNTLSGSTSSLVSLCQINCRCNTSEAWKKTSAVPWQPWG